MNGLFITNEPWDSSPSKSFDGKSITLTTTGSWPGISIQEGSRSIFHSQKAGHMLKYRVLGKKYLVILDTGPGNPSTRSVSVVDFSKWVEVMILSVTAANSIASPIVNRSQGSATDPMAGTVFLAWGSNGTQATGVGIYRSDNGNVLCSLGSPITPTGEIKGEATSTEVIIHYSTANMSRQQKCSRPRGECEISPPLHTFPDVYIGGCSFTPSTKQFTIKNVGDDCLTVNSVTDSPPFGVISTTVPLPAILSENEIVQVDVKFDPVAVGNWTSSALLVNISPANGDNQFVCKGKTLPAEFKIQFNSTTISFGKNPVGTSAPNRALTITNNGSKPLSVSVPSLNVSGFTCASFSGMLTCGQSTTISMSFIPPSEGSHSAMLSAVSDAPGSPHMITVLGEGCIANAEILVDSSTPIELGQVQQGFRTVRTFKVENLGDGPLTFSGSITGADAALFGLPDPEGSVTNAPTNRIYTVLPVSSCGPGVLGSGKAIVAVSFFANNISKVVSGTLTLSSHNATNFPASQSWTFPLSAEIIPPVALDVGLVVDRSGSMNDTLGSRVKMEAAISASQLFVELLRADLDDRVAVTKFNHIPDIVVSMSSVSSTNPPTQNDLLQTLQIDIMPAIGSTAIAGGTLTGIKEIQKPRPTLPPKLNKVLVVLSDGKENTGFEDPQGSGNWYSILGGQMLRPIGLGWVNTSPMSKPSDINVYTIGLGIDSEIDTNQLIALADDPKYFFHINQDLKGVKYFELEKYYTQIFMEIVEKSSVVDPMFWISPGDKHIIEFDVLRGDVNALVVIYDYEGYRLPFYSISPTGEIVDPVIIPTGYQLRSGATSKARFVEFKMPMNEPDRYSGRWKVVIEHPMRVCFGIPPRQGHEPGFLPKECKEYKDPILYGVAIGVGSNFRMMSYVTPVPVYVGDAILLTALVSEAGLPVTSCQVTVTATSPSGANWTMQLLDDGVHSDGEPNDGEYAGIFTHTYGAGTYHFTFKATGFSHNGEPVTRESIRDKPVLSRVVVQDVCCKQLIKTIQEQTKILLSYARSKTAVTRDELKQA
jgi:hypothetical protein